MEQRSRRGAVEGGRVGGHPGRRPTAGHPRAAFWPRTATAGADTRRSSATRGRRGAARASRGEATAPRPAATRRHVGREREGEGEWKEGKPGAEAVEAAFRDREERRRARERKRRRDILRRAQKEKQKLLFIFGRPDSEPT